MDTLKQLPALVVLERIPVPVLAIAQDGAVVFATFKALVAIGLFGMVAIGFLFARMTLAERVLAFAAALCLLGDFRLSDTAGFGLTIAIVIWQWRQRPPARPVAA